MSDQAFTPPTVKGLAPIRMAPEQRAQLLEDSKWANEFKWPELLKLAQFVTAHRIAPGQPLFLEGSSGDYACLIIAGEVGVVKRTRDYQMKTIAVVGPGKTIGEMSLIDRQPRSATAMAKEETTVLVLSREAMSKMATDQPEICVKLIYRIARLLSQWLRRTSGELVEVLQNQD